MPPLWRRINSFLSHLIGMSTFMRTGSLRLYSLVHACSKSSCSTATIDHHHWDQSINQSIHQSGTSSTVSSLFSLILSSFFLHSNFDKLAHGPRGTEAAHSLYIYRFHPSDGSLTLLNIQGEAKQVVNPAFSRFHPRLNVVYTVRTFVRLIIARSFCGFYCFL